MISRSKSPMYLLHKHYRNPPIRGLNSTSILVSLSKYQFVAWIMFLLLWKLYFLCVSLQPYLFVLFAGMVLLLDQTLGKPLKSQELEQRDHNITEGQLESSQAVNSASQIRGKRDLFRLLFSLKETLSRQKVLISRKPLWEGAVYVLRL